VILRSYIFKGLYKLYLSLFTGEKPWGSRLKGELEYKHCPALLHWNAFPLDGI